MSVAQSTATSSPPSPTTAAEAEKLISHLIDVMDALLGIVENETALVRSGRLIEAARLETSKADLTQLYIADIMRLKASQDRLTQLVPDSLSALRQRHDQFRALLQINLTVLATAQAVSEGIVRGVSGEMARKTAPQTYGAGGRPTAIGPNSGSPLAISRRL
jgi:hypothetical protein